MLPLFLILFSFHLLLPFSTSFENSTSPLCHYHEMMALLHFKNGFTIYPQFDDGFYPKTKSWKEEVDCCLWDGVTCDSISAHVIGLNLSYSQLNGIINSNSTLFHLRHLQALNLAENNFYSSRISPKFGHFSCLKFLNLSYSGFTGDVPVELGLLSKLLLLDLSTHHDYSLSMPYFDKIMRNLTNLKLLHLGSVSINSTFPQTLANLSSLLSLELRLCDLQGVFPPKIMNLPHMRSLSLSINPTLYVDPSLFNNFSTSLEVIDFSATNILGNLPAYLIESRPTRLREISLSDCSITGTIPAWIWNTTEVIDLSLNQFSGELPLTINKEVLSQLTLIDLDNNLLEGSIPHFYFTLPLLNALFLGMNHFSGKLDRELPFGNTSLQYLGLEANNLTIELTFFSKMENLILLGLSNNPILLTRGLKNSFSLPKLEVLDMNSCNMGGFPNFSTSTNLKELDLSNNKIQGEIPTWLYDVGRNSLILLNISHNNITGRLELLSWKNLHTIDVRSNSFQGLLPFPPPSTYYAFLASNNQFHGEMWSSFCNLSLTYLDLSNNQLNGKLPNCLGELSDRLHVLDLGSNLFHGVISMNFKKSCSLISIHLDKNEFEGKIPSSLMRCKSLQVLNLGNNHFNGSFPNWLDTLPKLQVLVIKSNNFQGTINDHSKKNKHPFSKLQILDLSNNHFSGRLSARYFENFKALMVNRGSNTKNNLEYIGNFYDFYQDSLVLTAKGMPLTYKILTILVAFDFSNNLFSGEIPDSIGLLVDLVYLNFSYNQFSGHIPSSLANLSLLESLDLSTNRLQGNIPPQLVRLTFLEKFNVSENELVGSIPLGSQFSTFTSDSYIGNPGLCGDPLPKCGGYDHQPNTPSSQYDFFDFVTSFSLWGIILLGFGFGIMFGLVIGGYMLYTVRPLWFSREADKLEYKMVQSFKKHFKQRRRN